MAPIFQYDFTREQPEDVRLEGGAMYPADITCLRLTRTVTNNDDSITPEPMNWGRAIYRNSVSFLNSFQTTIKFTVSPKATYATPADGLVFFMAPHEHKFPSETWDGNFGIFNPKSGKASNVFAIEFDTYINRKWDPDFSPHLGFDMGSRISKVTNYVPDTYYIGHEVTLTINYAEGVITAMIKTESHPGYTMTYSYDLSTILNDEDVIVGLGASTGVNVAFHDVFYWDFYSPSPSPAHGPPPAPN